MMQSLDRLALSAALVATTGACVAAPRSCRAPATYGGLVPVIVTRDERISIAQLACASDMGDVSATVELARRLENGIGAVADPQKAVRLYRQAAKPIPRFQLVYSSSAGIRSGGGQIALPDGRVRDGSSEAQYRLGRMYLEGRGVDRNIVRGRRYLGQAAKRGNAAAVETLAELQADR